MGFGWDPISVLAEDACCYFAFSARAVCIAEAPAFLEEVV